MPVQSAVFVKSSQELDQLPPPDRPEYAFIGRSNVGKSSLINRLCNKKALAKTSSTPGKTQLINHFLVDDHWYLVDLPGYGYAQVSDKQRKQFERMIDAYLQLRPNLVNIFVLVDSRHPLQELDQTFMRSLGEIGLPFSIAFTKTDKLGTNALAKKLNAYRLALQEDWEELPPQFITSAETGAGMEELLQYIQACNSSWVDLDLPPEASPGHSE